MKGERDEGKQMVPLFPGLHINDRGKGGPRAPPRNKMALFEDCNVASETSKIESRSRSRPALHIPPRIGLSSLVSQASSSSSVDCSKRKLDPIFATMNECPHSAERYYPHCSQNPSSSTTPMMKTKCIPLKPPRVYSHYSNCSSHNPGHERNFALPCFLQSGKTLDCRNLHLGLEKEKVAMFSSVSSGNLHSACLELPYETISEAQIMEHPVNLGEENSELSQNNGTVQPSHQKKNSSGDEMSRPSFPYLSLSYPRVGDCNQRTKVDLIKQCSNDKDCGASKVRIAVKKEELSDTFVEGSIPGLNSSNDEVARVIGRRLFHKARRTMIHQQKIFSLQMFELHRLITVQRLIARSPDTLHNNNFHPNKPSIKFPPMNKLLFVSPLDTSSPSVAKTKADALKFDPVMDYEAEALRGLLPLPATNVEKGHLAQPLTPKPLPNSASIPSDPKLAPWCFPHPPGSQWLIPARSPSEGLIYKPYTGPCFPTVGFMNPVYGNCGPISLGSLNGASYGVPAPNEHGTGGFNGAELGQSYFQTYSMPFINASGSNNEMKPMIGIQVGELDKSSFKVVSDSGLNLHLPKASERPCSRETSPPKWLERDALSLFPTTTLFQMKNPRNEQKVQAIKVVPHNRNSAPASAARIFQSIQEERRKHE